MFDSYVTFSAAQSPTVNENPNSIPVISFQVTVFLFELILKSHIKRNGKYLDLKCIDFFKIFSYFYCKEIFVFSTKATPLPSPGHLTMEPSRWIILNTILNYYIFNEVKTKNNWRCFLFLSVFGVIHKKFIATLCPTWEFQLCLKSCKLASWTTSWL